MELNNKKEVIILFKNLFTGKTFSWMTPQSIMYI
jgi:hypothetical protein